MKTIYFNNFLKFTNKQLKFENKAKDILFRINVIEFYLLL